MKCHDVLLPGGAFQIAIEEGRESPRFTAAVMAVDLECGEATPLVFPDGQPAQVHATSETLAFRSALAWLQERFGWTVRVR
jgi:hypothetical protein